MFRRFQLCTVLLAWLMATGSHWDVAQTIGWGRMIANYAQSMPLLEAVRLTFTPGNECSVCTVVREAKKAEQAATPAAAKTDTKITLVFQPSPTVIFTVPPTRHWSLGDHEFIPVERTAPPLPPPRVYSA
jgi:hypothetical protein